MTRTETFERSLANESSEESADFDLDAIKVEEEEEDKNLTVAFLKNAIKRHQITYQECAHNLCFNGGVCWFFSTGQFLCACPVGTTGYQCEFKLNRKSARAHVHRAANRTLGNAR